MTTLARLPDVFQRMHASTKAGGIGTTLVLLSESPDAPAGQQSSTEQIVQTIRIDP